MRQKVADLKVENSKLNDDITELQKAKEGRAKNRRIEITLVAKD